MPGFELIGSLEQTQVLEVFQRGGILFRRGFEDRRNDCYKVREFEEAFASAMNANYSLAVSSGTAALRVALAALGIGNGDEVITQSFTFVATAEAIIESGASPVCADIDLTLNLDPIDLEKRITPRSKAVIVVHMLGTPANLPEIKRICQKHDLFLIEDTAWGCGGNLGGVPLGSWGDVGTFSFDFAKTITTGEGGMLIFRDEDVYKRAAAWHDHGHENNPNVPRWEDTRSSSGFNFRMMELQAAVGLAQLSKLDTIVTAQRANSLSIWDLIKNIPGLEPRTSPEGSYETADALVFLVPNRDLAVSCRQELVNVNLTTKILPEAYSWHFAGTWDHMTELLESHNGDLQNSFINSNSILERAVSLPIGVYMDESVPFRVKTAITKALSSS